MCNHKTFGHYVFQRGPQYLQLQPQKLMFTYWKNEYFPFKLCHSNYKEMKLNCLKSNTLRKYIGHQMRSIVTHYCLLRTCLVWQSLWWKLIGFCSFSRYFYGILGMEFFYNVPIHESEASFFYNEIECGIGFNKFVWVSVAWQLYSALDVSHYRCTSILVFWILGLFWILVYSEYFGYWYILTNNISVQQ